MKDLITVFHQIKSSATIPAQWTTSLIALLPKSSEIERPIALVASLYRLWCRRRNPYSKSWQIRIQHDYPWERAVPSGSTQESFHDRAPPALKKTVISVLLDMSNFYDRINLEKLAERWTDSDRFGLSGHACSPSNANLLWSPHS